MKKTILTFAILLVGLSTHAQINKGDLQLGGSVNLFTSNQGEFDRSAFNISPRFGKFFSNTLSAGLQVGYSGSTLDTFNPNDASIEEFKSSSFQVGVYVRLHKPVSKNLYLFLQPSINYGSGTNKQDGTEVSDFNTLQLGASPGLVYFISPKFSFDMTVGNIGYASSTTKATNTESTTDQFNLNMSLSNTSLGLSFYIR